MNTVSFPLPLLSTLLAGLAILLLVITTVGVLYLTAAEWRDRRRQTEDKKQQR